MSHRTKLCKELEQAGYSLVRHNKHLVYKNFKGSMIVVPNHNKMNELTFRRIMRQIERDK